MNRLKCGKDGIGSRGLVLLRSAALFSATVVRFACSGLWPRALAEPGQLRRQFDDAIIELTGLIAFQNLSSKFNAALGVAPQGFCTPPLPQDDRTVKDLKGG